MSSKRFQETIATTAGVGSEKNYGSVIPALSLSASYSWKNPTCKPEFDYARSGNPNRRTLENALCDLEGAARGVVTSSGMAAIDLVLALVNPGDLVIAPHDCYGGTYRLLTARAKKGHFKLSLVDQTDIEALKIALQDKPKLVFIETPSNPLLRITDIKRVVTLAKSVGALTVADNTLLSPALQRPLSYGCDVVLHSTTKLINGHSDVVGGAVLAKDLAVGEELAWWANCTGNVGAPFDSYLTLRGLRTLFPRVSQQQVSALELAVRLQSDSRVAKVFYPGLESHEGYEIARRQQNGFGIILSVEFHENVDVKIMLRELRLFNAAVSLGGFESLACIPAAMTHASMSPEARKTAGISDRLVRLSVGLEHSDDLVQDVFNALDTASIREVRTASFKPALAYYGAL